MGLETLVLVLALVLFFTGRGQTRALARRIDALERRLNALGGGPAPAPLSEAPAAIPTGVVEPIAAVAPPSTTASLDDAAPEILVPVGPSAIPATPSAAPRPQRNFEERFGTRWTVWVGGLALALGGVFLVQYSIEQGLLGPGVRVFLGGLLAVLLIAGGEWTRRREHGIAALPAANVPSILTAAGTVVAFATVYVAYALYGFLSPAAAFILLGAVAIATLAASLIHGPALAGLGMVAAYVTPLLVASNVPNYWALTLYLIVVTAASLALAGTRRWLWLVIATLVLDGAWSLFIAAEGSADIWAQMANPVAGFALVAVFVVAGLLFGPDAAKDRVDRVSSAGLIVYLVLAGLVVVANNHDGGMLLAFALLAGAAVVVAWRTDAAAGAVPGAAIVVVLVILAWAVVGELPSGLRPGGPGVGPTLDPRLTSNGLVLGFGVVMGALFGWSGFAVQGRSERPQVPLLWAATAAAAPPAILAAIYYRLTDLERSLPLAPAFLVGACFTVTLGWLSRTVGSARASGWLLAAATGGSMVGAIAASFVSIPLTGIEMTLATALLLHALGGSLVLSRMKRYWPSLATVAIFGMVFFRPAWDVRVVQSGPYIYGAPERKGDDRKLLFARDDHVASIAVFETSDGNRLLRIDGKTDASMSRLDLVTQLLTAHIPLALHDKPRRIALIGLGSGMTLASCLRYGPERVDCIEISPAVVRASRFFDEGTGKPLDDPRVRLHVADARAAIRDLKEPFDVILNEPSNLWIAGMAGLFTEEFYKTCRDRLAEGGLMGQWIHAYGLPSESFRDAVSTFLQVFPHATLWEMWVSGDYLLVGSAKPYVIDADALAKRLAVPAIQEDLARIDADSVAAFLSDLVASTDDLLGLRQGARIQTDDGLHLEFSAPLGFYGRRRMPALNVLPPVNAERLERIVQGRPVAWSESRTLLRRAILSIDEKKPRAETIGLLQDALKRYPDERQARIVLEDQADQCIRDGNREVAKGRVKEALESFALVPDESAAFAEARLRRVVLLKREKAEPEKIAEEYRRILATLPDHGSSTSGLCEILIAQGKAGEAEQVAARAVQLNPKSALFRLTRGKSLAALQRKADAVVEWEEAKKLDPTGPHGKEAERLLQEK